MSSFGVSASSLQDNYKAIRPVEQKVAGLSGTIVKWNGTTNFGIIEAGTVLGRITSGGKLRPVGKAVIGDTVSASTSVPVGSAKTLFVGDSVTVKTKLGVAGTRTITLASGVTATATGRNRDGLAHTIAIVDPSANSQSLRQVVTFNTSTGVATIQIYAATGGGGAITSTADDIIAELNRGTAGTLVKVVLAGGSGSTTAVAASALALQNGLAAGGTLSSGNAITARDTTSSPNTVTLTSAITAVAGDTVELADGSQTAVGSLETAKNPYHVHASAAAGAAVHTDQDCTYSCQGLYTEAQLVGLNAETLSDLGGKDFGATIRL